MAQLDSENFKTYFYERFGLDNRWQAFVPIAKFLNTLKAAQRFHLLFPILQDEHEHPYEYQKAATGLMLKVDAACPLSVHEAATSVLGSLDLSIQEFPFFLAKRYGRDHVLEQLASIDTASFDESQKKRLDTLVYWTRGYTEGRYEELRQRWSERIKG